MYSRESLSRYALVAVLIAMVATVWFGCGGVEISHYYDHCVVATAAPQASDVGKAVFEQGGNAFDAAAAVALALAVVHPEAGNIGGGGFAVIRDGASGQVRALDFRETAPSAAFEKMYLDDRDSVIPGMSTLGALAVGVPGTVAGIYELWHEYGTLPWEDLVAPAAALADSGYIVDAPLAARLAEYREQLIAFPETARLFLIDGKSPVPGERLTFPDLARTLYIIASEGPDGFYRGKVAEQITACMETHGGMITAGDLENYQPQWRQPISFSFDSLEIYSMPPPSSGGICLGQILKILEPYDFALYAPRSVEYMHLFCEAARLAFADRSEHLGDPDFYDIPGGLLDDDYLERRRTMIDIEHASTSDKTRNGSPPIIESDETTHFSICDADGNMVSITYTLNTAFGSKLAVDGAGFLLNNEMDDFSVKPGVPNVYGLVGGQANRIEPGKRMLSSMSPTLVLKAGRPFMALGSPGGSKIITIVAEAVINFTRFGKSLGETVNHPRFHHQWLPDVVYLEQGGFDINVKQGLIRLGHNIEERVAYGDLQAVFITEDGLWTGASDQRGRGKVTGY